MDKATHKIHIADWRFIIKQCHVRPAGHSVKHISQDSFVKMISATYL